MLNVHFIIIIIIHYIGTYIYIYIIMIFYLSVFESVGGSIFEFLLTV